MNYRAWVVALALAAIAWALLACKRSEATGIGAASSSPPLVGEAAAIDADLGKLLSDYGANEVRADSEFKGQAVATAGVIRDIRKDAFGSIHVRFEGAEHHPGEPQADCIPDKSEQAIVASLSKGGVAAFRGHVRGLVLNTVLFGDCEIRTQETGR